MTATPRAVLEREIRTALSQLEASAGLREWQARAAEPAGGPTIRLAGAALCSFASNDYLGLAGHPEVIAAASAALQRYGAGATAAPGLGGYTEEHEALEEELACWLKRPRALLFSSGYLANLGLQSALLKPGQRVLHDRLNHASLLDASRLAGARGVRYAHTDPAAAATALARHHPALWITESLFSMDGDLAPLAHWVALNAGHGAVLVVDEAHALGVLGPEGRGGVALEGLDVDAIPLVVGTLGKALGSQGAFIAGAADLIDYLRQRARTVMFSTALAPVAVAAARAALRLSRQEPWRRERISQGVQAFRARAAAAGLPLLPAPSCIQALPLGRNARALAVSGALRQAGFWVPAIRPPTVPEGTARLRLSLTALHSEAEIEHLVATLKALLQDPGCEPELAA